MGKKLPNIIIYKKAIYNKNIPSVKKANKINNKYNKKKNKNKRKKNKYNQSNKNYSSKKKDKITNQNFYINNLNINNNNGNPFIFNSLFNNKKEKKKEKPDWMSLETKKIENINDRFNGEIYEYVNYIIPKDISLSQRQNTRQRLINIIKKYQPKWKVVLFGSFSQNTSTVFSDLDFAVLSEDIDSSRKMDINELIYLMKILKHDGFSRNIRLIRARVPILKATCSFTGINVDISVNRQNGYEAAGLIRKILKKYRILKPSIIILKILLKKNNLNDAHTGGMSSFLLFHLVYFYFITYKKRNERNIFNNNINMNMNMNEDEKDNSYIENSSLNEDNNNENEEKEEESDNNYDEEKEISYDSNSDMKWNGKNRHLTKDGIIITKPISSTDEEDNSNDDSNLVKNGSSSSYSEEKDSSTKYKNENNNKDDDKSNEDEDYEDDENENNDYDYLTKKYNNEEEKNNDEKSDNIGDFIFSFLKFYGKEFNYRELGFSLNENNFGNTFFKVERTDMDCSDYISVESIQEQGIDIGRSCYNYPKIANLFRASYGIIKIEKQKNTCSILKSLGFPSI